MRRVVVYHAQGCHLCERAIEVVVSARADTAFELVLVDIGGEPDLEERYRDRIPVIEVDGETAFTYFVTTEGLRDRLG